MLLRTNLGAVDTLSGLALWSTKNTSMLKTKLVMQRVQGSSTTTKLFQVQVSGDSTKGMDIVKIDGGFTLRRHASHVDGMARELGMDTATPSKTPEVKAETKETGDNKLLSTWQHDMYRTVVGIAVHCWDVPFTQFATIKPSPLISSVGMFTLTLTSWSSGGKVLGSFPFSTLPILLEFPLQVRQKQLDILQQFVFDIILFTFFFRPTSTRLCPTQHAPLWCLLQVLSFGEIGGVHRHSTGTPIPPP